MGDVAIRVEGLSKRYRIGGRQDRYHTLRDTLAEAAAAPFRRLRAAFQRDTEEPAGGGTIWALKDVSFEVKRGEVVGIIGRNGAGKSTLLKILSRITEPTAGVAEVRGRVGSLLEVGTGFHSELTGRENIYLNGAILGMKRAEIARKFDGIVAFAEVDEFIDTPVKHYSSGMYLRLAFAVAAHLDPEVLLVDEVLAVGDAGFQKKCLGKIGDVAQEGRTVLFVSHSMAAIATLCKAAVLLDKGGVDLIGSPSKIIEEYLVSTSGACSGAIGAKTGNRRGTGEVRVSDAAVLDGGGRPRSNFEYAEDVCVEFTINLVSKPTDLVFVVWVRTATGIPVLHLVNRDDPSWGPLPTSGRAKVRCVIQRCQLYPGTYFVSLWLGSGPYHEIDCVPDALSFRMEQGELLRLGFDVSWRHAIFHCETTWRQAEA